MEAFIIYLLKSSGILLLFYGCYHFFLSRETLFKPNRWFLVSGLLAAIFLPLVHFTKTVYVNMLLAAEGSTKIEALANQLNESVTSWPMILIGVYIFGSSFFILKFVFEINSARKFIKQGEKKSVNDLIYVQSSKTIQPFSFFKYIIYNPLNHKTADLKLILAHEHVHARQKHSLDILFMEIILLMQWFNPIAWLYKSVLKQNLEFLADTQNSAIKDNKKQYQYILLKHAVSERNLSIVNPFFNSLIKKRIVMINQIPSQKIKALKILTIIPLLALFLYSFNVKTEYSATYNSSKQSTGKIIELIIDKDTTDEELETIKKDLEKDGIDFSYTMVHNEKKEIINVSIQITGKSKNGGSFNNSYNSSDKEKAISPLVVFIDQEHNLISIGSKGAFKPNTFKLHTDDTSIWIDSDNEEHKEIHIKKVNGKKVITINGEEVNEEDLQDMDIEVKEDSQIFISKGAKNDKNTVFIRSDSDDDHDIEIISKEGSGFFFIDTNGDKELLFIVDGKESSSKKVKRLDPDDIESMNILKGEKAIKKYGKKGKAGVMVITTKKN